LVAVHLILVALAVKYSLKQQHLLNLGHMGDCNSMKVAPTHTCAQYQDCWYKHVV
jgi:hypothetical protein